MFANTLGYIGRKSLYFLVHISRIAGLMWEILRCLVLGPFKGKPIRFSMLFTEMEELGVRSLPLIGLVSLSLGAVMVILMAPQLRDLGAGGFVPDLVTVALVRELSPLLTGVALAGRVGASVTARLGTMKVSEEIMALEMMSISPIRFLVVPRFLAVLIMLPCLTIVADFIGLAAGLILATSKLGFNLQEYLGGIAAAFTFKDIFFSLLKSIVFAVIIMIVACYYGIQTEGGAEGVGRATMISVVTSIMLVIFADGILSLLFYL